MHRSRSSSQNTAAIFMAAAFESLHTRITVGTANRAALGRQRYAANKNNATSKGLSRTDFSVKYRTRISKTRHSKITANLELKRAAPIVLITPLPNVHPP